VFILSPDDSSSRKTQPFAVEAKRTVEIVNADCDDRDARLHPILQPWQLWIGYEPMNVVSTEDPSRFEWSARTDPANEEEVQAPG
jgi:hypothetical protein